MCEVAICLPTEKTRYIHSREEDSIYAEMRLYKYIHKKEGGIHEHRIWIQISCLPTGKVEYVY